MGYYKRHAFFCTNKREDGSACCQNHNAQEMRDYAKARIRDLKIAGKGGVRVNIAKCMMLARNSTAWFARGPWEKMHELRFPGPGNEPVEVAYCFGALLLPTGLVRVGGRRLALHS